MSLFNKRQFISNAVIVKRGTFEENEQQKTDWKSQSSIKIIKNRRAAENLTSIAEQQ